MPLLVRFSIIAFAAIGAVLLIGFGLVVAPEVDERAGFFTGRAMKAIQSYEINGTPLILAVSNEFDAVRWRSYHQDIPFQTFVECVGIPRAGGPEKRMLWYVEERMVWRNGPSLRIIFMTALNKDALKLTPDLYDPRVGFGLQLWRKGVELP